MNFNNLTENQQELLSFQGWNIGCNRNQPPKKSMLKLIERGLVIEHEIIDRGLSIKEYEVPLSVHIAWCEHCSKQEKQ